MSIWRATCPNGFFAPLRMTIGGASCGSKTRPGLKPALHSNRNRREVHDDDAHLVRDATIPHLRFIERIRNIEGEPRITSHAVLHARVHALARETVFIPSNARGRVA